MIVLIVLTNVSRRVGRTARAGRSGQCFTILRKEEVRFFKTILRKAENSRQKEFDIEWEQVNQLMPQYDVRRISDHCTLILTTCPS